MLFSLALNGFVPVDSVATIHKPTQVEGLMIDGIEAYGVGTLGIATAPSNGWCVKGLDLIGHKKFNDWISGLGLPDNVVQQLSTKLESSLGNLNGKNISEIVNTDVQGRFVIRTEARAVGEIKVITVEKRANGNFEVFEYKSAYLKDGEIGYPPLSKNKLAPDFSGNIEWLHPAMQNKPPVKIKVTGQMNTGKGIVGDVELANSQIGLSGSQTPTGYTWHHLDDFDPVTGECSMQLVKSDIHTKCKPHTGAVAQWENYTGTTYNRN